MKKNSNNHHVKVVGYITSSDWDKRGNVVEVTLETEDFEKYVIADSEKGVELINFIDENIKAYGQITGEDIYGNKILVVSKYEILNY